MKKNILIANMICDIILPKILLKMVYKCMFFFINFHDFTIIIVKNVLLGFFFIFKALKYGKILSQHKKFFEKKSFSCVIYIDKILLDFQENKLKSY